MSADLRFIEKIEQNVADHPENIALISAEAGKSMTYAELWEYSGRVYRFLKQRGIGKEDVVMIAVPRGINPIITLIGIWRAGAAAVMLTADCEPERMEYILRDAGCALKIDTDLLIRIMTFASLDGYEETSPHDLAYLIYTSGTMGKPKGVMQEYGTLDMCVKMHFCGKQSVIDGRFALIAPLSSAASMLIIPPLLYNAQTLAVIPRNTVRDPDRLPACIEQYRLTTLFIIPSMLKRMKRIPDSLTKIIVGGETAKKIYSDRTEIFCGYGQSESGFNITTFRIDREYDNTPVGRIGEQKAEICIMDDGGNELPAGETGNLCYKAPYFRGYLGLPELTEQVHLNGYIRSGDVGVIRPDGVISVTGRADEMIKIRGNRIEPAEIEAVLREILQVEWVGVRGILDHQHPYLCAYYEGEPKRSVEEAAKLAARRLPPYMIPACFMKIDCIPRDAGGKIVKRNLPIPDRDDGEKEQQESGGGKQT
jgi:acyl-coenzyme A synthetase/AMP-(fatty) acid ligase